MKTKNTDSKTKKTGNSNEDTEAAHVQAEKDISKDPETKTDATDDLDEGELARLEGEK